MLEALPGGALDAVLIEAAKVELTAVQRLCADALADTRRRWGVHLSEHSTREVTQP